MSRIIQGTPASPGIAIAKVFIPQAIEQSVQTRCVESPEEEWENFNKALEKSKIELQRLRDKTRNELGDLKAEIFEAHLSILEDPELAAGVKTEILETGLRASMAMQKTAQTFINLLLATEDDLFKARIDDIKDLTLRVCGHIEGAGSLRWQGLKGEVIILAPDLTPSETTQFNPTQVLGFVTLGGSKTSHSSILARSLEIPAVVGVGSLTEDIPAGSTIIIDGSTGTVIVDPDENEQEQYLLRKASWREELRIQKEFAQKETRTLDGKTLELAANIGGTGDLVALKNNRADGVGLFRTEFMYMDRTNLPSEEEQYQVYKTILEALAPKPVVIRTLDIGGDKQLQCLPQDLEMNPFLGVRAIRLCFQNPEIFRTQLRALLRASIHGKLRIMFPMIATLEELQRAKSILSEERNYLVNHGISVSDNFQIGIMIEIPAAAVMADILAKEADFFSIGTNDLIQYTLAADRMNPKVSYLYQPLNPAILRLIRQVVSAAHAQGKWAGVCGEMAADPLALPLLLGMGIDELSMTASSIVATRSLTSRIDTRTLQSLVQQSCECSMADEVRHLVQNFMNTTKEVNI